MKLFEYDVEEIFENVYKIADTPAINSYLIIGSKKGMLIDTGCAVGNIRKVVEELCPYDYYVVNTHAHSDHVAGNYQFDDIYISNKEKDVMMKLYLNDEEKKLHYKMMETYNVHYCNLDYKNKFDKAKISFNIHTINDGDIFDLGNIHIQAIEVAGHTLGGMAFLDIENKRLYNGDIILRHTSILHIGGTNMKTLIAGLEKLWSMKDKFDITIAAHGHRSGFEPLPPEYIAKLIQCANEATPDKSFEKVVYDGVGYEYKLQDDDVSIAYKIDQI